MDPILESSDELVLLHDDVTVVPAAEAWAQRLQAEFLPGPAAMFATTVARMLQDELDADHVALWCEDGDDQIVLGAAGLNPRTMRSRVSERDPARRAMGTPPQAVRFDHIAHRAPRATEVPGLRSSEAVLVPIDGPGPVVLVSVSGDSVPTGVEEAVRDLVRLLPWDQTT